MLGCDDGKWDYDDAVTICKQLGLPEPLHDVFDQ